MNVYELVRPQFVIAVLKYRFQFSRAGSRINLVIDGEQLSRCQLRLIVAAVGVHRERAFLHSPGYSLQLVLGKREQDRDGL